MSDPFEEWGRRLDEWNKGWRNGFRAGFATAAVVGFILYTVI